MKACLAYVKIQAILRLVKLGVAIRLESTQHTEPKQRASTNKEAKQVTTHGLTPNPGPYTILCNIWQREIRIEK